MFVQLFRLGSSLKKRHMLLLKKSALLQCPKLNAPQVYLNQPSSSTSVSINGVKGELFKDLYFRYMYMYMYMCVCICVNYLGDAMDFSSLIM